MRFFDSKEEVLDVQITKYGRHLLSQGQWRPVYYAFFDDNILYDSQYAGYAEATSSARSRIQDETPLLRTQTNFTGRDEYLFDAVGDLNERVTLGIYEKLNVMPMSMGTSSPESLQMPAYKLQFLQGEIKGLQNNLTGSVRDTNLAAAPSVDAYSQQLLKIPQIEIDVEFKITVVSPDNPQTNFEIDPALTPGTIYADDTEIVIGPEQILFVMEEKNAPFDYKNYDIEVFEMTDDIGSSGEQVLSQLSFVKPLEMVENNILLDVREAEIKAGRVNGSPPDIDPTFVQYFFNINVDDEIDENILCKSISRLKRMGKSLYTDIEIDCPDVVVPFGTDIYASDAVDEDCPDY